MEKAKQKRGTNKSRRRRKRLTQVKDDVSRHMKDREEEIEEAWIKERNLINGGKKGTEEDEAEEGGGEEEENLS